MKTSRALHEFVQSCMHAGVGLTISYDRRVRPRIEAGELVAVLEEYWEPFQGFYLYFPRRRHRSAALQALIDHVRGRVRAQAG